MHPIPGTPRRDAAALDASTQPAAPPPQKKEKAGMSWEATIAQMHALSQSKKKPKVRLSKIPVTYKSIFFTLFHRKIITYDLCTILMLKIFNFFFQTPKVEPKPEPPKQPNKKQTNNQASTNSSIIQSRSASTVSELSSTDLNLAPSKKQRKILERKLREQQAEQERIQNEMESKAAKRQKEKNQRTSKHQEQAKSKFETKASKKFYETDIIDAMASLRVNKNFEEKESGSKSNNKKNNTVNTDAGSKQQQKKGEVFVQPEVFFKFIYFFIIK